MIPGTVSQTAPSRSSTSGIRGSTCRGLDKAAPTSGYDASSGAADKEAGRQAEALARHVASLDAALGAIPIEAFAAGRFHFPPGSIAAGDLK